jgi:hypothetical protein
MKQKASQPKYFNQQLPNDATVGHTSFKYELISSTFGAMLTEASLWDEHGFEEVDCDELGFNVTGFDAFLSSANRSTEF